jgi:hypothetical protein
MYFGQEINSEIKYFGFGGKLDQVGAAIQGHIRKKV